jgi:hypothetical protein
MERNNKGRRGGRYQARKEGKQGSTKPSFIEARRKSSNLLLINIEGDSH